MNDTEPAGIVLAELIMLITWMLVFYLWADILTSAGVQ